MAITYRVVSLLAAWHRLLSMTTPQGENTDEQRNDGSLIDPAPEAQVGYATEDAAEQAAEPNQERHDTAASDEENTSR